MASEQGGQALQLVDKLLAERPTKETRDFSAATRCLTAFRDALIEDWRATRSDPARQRMARANAVISVIVGGHYPRGDIPWQHIEQARQQLAALLQRAD